MSALILEKLCRGCQRCVRACSQDAISMSSSLAIVDPEKCVDCEECLEVCMHGAITFYDTNKQKRLAEIELKIKDLKKRWPAHSVSPKLIMELEELEGERDEIKKAL